MNTVVGFVQLHPFTVALIGVLVSGLVAEFVHERAEHRRHSRYVAEVERVFLERRP